MNICAFAERHAFDGEEPDVTSGLAADGDRSNGFARAAYAGAETRHSSMFDSIVAAVFLPETDGSMSINVTQQCPISAISRSAFHDFAAPGQEFFEITTKPSMTLLTQAIRTRPSAGRVAAKQEDKD